jgi:hypothetical protein
MAAEVSLKNKSKTAVLGEVGSSNQTVRIKMMKKDKNKSFFIPKKSPKKGYPKML